MDSVCLNHKEHAALQYLVEDTGIPSSAGALLERVRAGGEAPTDIRKLIQDEVRDVVRDALKASS